MTGEPQCPVCGGAKLPIGVSYIGTLALCRCQPQTMNGTTWYNVAVNTGPTQLDRIEQKLDELLRILRNA
jgi:hypothetical protein